MKGNNGKGASGSSSKVPIILFFFVLCAFSFYLGGVYCSDKTRRIVKSEMRDERPQPTTHVQTDIYLTGNAGAQTIKPFPECTIDYQDYTPCTDPNRWRKYGNYRLSFMERHCPPIFERKECLVPPPEGYQPTMKWPMSRKQCWYKNVPYDWINNEKSNQHWLVKEGDKFNFPGGGTMFPDGVSAYIDLMENLIPGMKDGTVRTAIDTGCGVASWGGDLLDRGILTVSLAPRDNHEARFRRS